MLRNFASRQLSIAAVLPLSGLMLLTVSRACGAAEPTPGVEEIKNVTIAVGGQPYTGDLIPPATESGFKFRWSETGDLLTFRWSSLEESERTKVQKFFGIKVAEGGTHLEWGEEVECVRLKLPNNRFLEGKLEPERALPGFHCIRNATQVVQIPQHEVLSMEKIRKKESDIYPPEEALNIILLRTPPQPDSAADYLELARKCSIMGLYEQAMDYLDMAKSIDATTEERTRDFRKELVVKHQEVQASKLYEQIVMDIHREEFGGALAKCNKFIANFPNSERVTKVQSLMPEITDKSKVDISKQVIFMYYNLLTQAIQERMAKKIKIDAKGLPVAAIPGKQVTTRTGNIIRGEPQGGEMGATGGVVKIRQGDLTIEIPEKDILTIQDIDLSKGVKMVPPTFEELKAYVTDASGGLGGDLINRISTALGRTPSEVREIWENRFVQTAVLKDGVLTKTPVYTRLNKAFYDKGSWLRVAGAAGTGTGNNRNRQQGGGGNTRQRIRNLIDGQQQQQDEQEKLKQMFPEYSDDPEVWWKVQSDECKLKILRAFAAENIFKVKELQGKTCPECGGKGVIERMGHNEPVMCPSCRGLKVHTVVLYE